MSQRPMLARFLFATFSSAANRATWRAVVAAGAMLGAAPLASADDAKKPAPPPAESKQVAPEAIMAKPEPAGAVLMLAQPAFDFGSLEAGKVKTYDVTFTNSGTEPLKLDKKKVVSSCRCLVATFSKTTIAPGATGKMKLRFTAPRQPGDAEHTVVIKYITSAATKAEGSATVTFTGFVEAKRPRTNPQRFEGRGFVLS
jgi:hypothetical protein